MHPHRNLTSRLLAWATALSIGVSTAAAQQPPRPGATPSQAPPRSPYQEAGQLPARIMSFTADPETIKPGETVTLKWAVENPRTTTIEPTIGRAAPVLADLHPAAVREHRQGGDAGQVEEGDRRQREALEQDARDLRRVERASDEVGRVHGSGAGGE